MRSSRSVSGSNQLISSGLYASPTLIQGRTRCTPSLSWTRTATADSTSIRPNSTSVTQARVRFEELNEAGYIAAKRTGDGTSELIRQFDPTVHETLFIPRLVGG